MVKLSHSALGYFGTRLAQTRRSLHSLADPSLVSGEPKASHMAGIKEWRNQMRLGKRSSASATGAASSPSLLRRLQTQMSVHHRAVRTGHDRNAEAELTDRRAHAIHGLIVLARITGIRNQPLEEANVPRSTF